MKSGEVGVGASGGRVCVACVGELGASWPLGSVFPRCPGAGLGRVMVGAQQPSLGQETGCLSASHSKEEKEVGVYPVDFQSSWNRKWREQPWALGSGLNRVLSRPPVTATATATGSS